MPSSNQNKVLNSIFNFQCFIGGILIWVRPDNKFFCTRYTWVSHIFFTQEISWGMVFLTVGNWVFNWINNWCQAPVNESRYGVLIQDPLEAIYAVRHKDTHEDAFNSAFRWSRSSMVTSACPHMRSWGLGSIGRIVYLTDLVIHQFNSYSFLVHSMLENCCQYRVMANLCS